MHEWDIDSEESHTGVPVTRTEGDVWSMNLLLLSLSEAIELPINVNIHKHMCKYQSRMTMVLWPWSFQTTWLFYIHSFPLCCLAIKAKRTIRTTPAVTSLRAIETQPYFSWWSHVAEVHSKPRWSEKSGIFRLNKTPSVFHELLHFLKTLFSNVNVACLLKTFLFNVAPLIFNNCFKTRPEFRACCHNLSFLSGCHSCWNSLL